MSLNITKSQQQNSTDFLGCGIGLRPFYYQEIIDTRPAIDWFEIISEDYMVPGGKALYFLDKVRENYPIVMHGVSLSIGSTDPLNWDYLHKLKKLAERVHPAWISDHCCWTGVSGLNMHDLLPLPYTEEALHHIVDRIKQVQDFLGRQIAIENVSSYVEYAHSTITEWDFLKTMSEMADCKLLFDVNNVYVSSFNHGFDPHEFIDNIPVNRVQQFHLAGHTNKGDVIVDTHDAAIIDEVWSLYAYSIKRFGRISTLIERDDHFPPLSELLDELAKAKGLINSVSETSRKHEKYEKADHANVG